MASFENVWLHEPSAYAEGFGTLSIPPSAAEPHGAVARIASAHSELATLRGNDAVHSTPEHLTRALQASQSAVALVGTSATTHHISARQIA